MQNIIEIGIGPHAKRVYIPALRKYSQKYPYRLKLIVDLEEKAQELQAYFEEIDWKVDSFFVQHFDSRFLPEYVEDYLTRYVKEHNVTGVIISTEPLCHFAYAKWALKMGLHVLIDKPISTYKNVVEDWNKANQIELDFFELLEDYNRLQKVKKTIFSINAQRRYHPGFNLIFEEINRVTEKTGCPITALQSTHCDGQWRMPSEIVTMDYHPYNTGYGKASHSGYHFFDIIFELYRRSVHGEKIADRMEVFSSLVKPRGLLKQLGENDYLRLFGDDYLNAKQFSDNELGSLYRGYGEVDVTGEGVLMRFLLFVGAAGENGVVARLCI